MNITKEGAEVQKQERASTNGKSNVESVTLTTDGVSNIVSENKIPAVLNIPRRHGVLEPEPDREPTEAETLKRETAELKELREQKLGEFQQLNRVKGLLKPSVELPKIKSAKTLVEQNISIPNIVVAGLLHQGSKMVLGGGSKSFKTWGLCDLAISVANGVKWWGLNTHKGRVLYINFEIQEGFFGKRLESILSAKGLGAEALDNIDVWNLRGHCADLSLLMGSLLDGIQKDHYCLIVIDPIYKGMGKRDENAAGDINTLLNEIERMAVKTGAAVVFGAHFSKGNQAAKESIDRISGSGMFARDPDTILIMTQHENEYTYTVEPTLRNFAPMEPFCVRWNHPLMERDETSDPGKLKVNGRKVETYTTEQLLEELGDQELTTTAWQLATSHVTGMKKRTFMEKLAKIKDDKTVLIKTGDDKWKAVKPIIKKGNIGAEVH